MRDTCLLCVRKHLGQAEALMQEVVLGYPEHKWLAIGHLAEAEAELLDYYPTLAEVMRMSRKEYMTDDTPYPTVSFLREVTRLESRDGQPSYVPRAILSGQDQEE